MLGVISQIYSVLPQRGSSNTTDSSSQAFSLPAITTLLDIIGIFTGTNLGQTPSHSLPSKLIIPYPLSGAPHCTFTCGAVELPIIVPFSTTQLY